jgi:hypothetical protein
MILFLTILPASGITRNNMEKSLFKIENNFYNDIFSNRMIIRIYNQNNNISIPRNSNILGGSTGKYIDVLMTKSELKKVIDDSISYSIIDYDYYGLNEYAEKYHSLSEMEQFLFETNDNFSNITRLFSIGLSYEGRDIWCLEISDNPGVNEGEPGVLFTGVHHAREWPTLEICLNIINQLTSSYGFDENITNIVNSRRIWIVT